MEQKKSVLKNQQGFTLIEIIAVLVVLGILAAVAIPKFLDMQVQAREAAVNGALAAAASNVTSAQAADLLAGGPGTVDTVFTKLNGSSSPDYKTVGDFTVNYTKKGDTGIEIKVTKAPFDLDKLKEDTKTKTVTFQ